MKSLLKTLCIAGAMLAALSPALSYAQNYPSKPIRLVVPFPPGGSTDYFGRVTATRLGEALGEQVVVDNRGGAGGNIGAQIAAKAAADGYTLLLGHTGTLAINPALYPAIPYDPVRDFSPVGLVASTALVLVSHPSLPARSVKDLIGLAKSKPGSVNYASGGSGTGTHLSAELFKMMAGVNITHVPYKGSGPAIIAVLSGEASILFTPIPAAAAHVKAERFRAIGITDTKRSKTLPGVPTIAESGLSGYESVLRFGVLAPAGVTPRIVEVLSKSLLRAMATPEVAEQLARQGAELNVSGPEEYRTLILSELKKWAPIVKASGARVD